MEGLKSILIQHQQGNISTDKAERLIDVLYGRRSSAVCMLDRLPKNCSVYLYTEAKDCRICGHFREL